MKRLKRYNKKVTFAFVFAFVVAVTGIFSTSFVSSAAYYEFLTPHSRPTTDIYSGYITAVVSSDLKIFVWRITPDVVSAGDSNTNIDDFPESLMNISIIPSGITFNAVSDSYAYLTIWELRSDGGAVLHVVQQISKSYSWTSWCGDISAYSLYGNYGSVSDSVNGLIKNTVTVSWNGETDTLSYLISIYHELQTMGDSVDNIETLIQQYLYTHIYSMDYKLKDIYNILNQYAPAVDSKLQDLIDKTEKLIEEQEESNTWLEKIWNSIQEFINPKSADEEAANDFNAESEGQKSEIDSLNQQNQTEKVDVDSAAAQVDANINYDNMAQYGGVLATITNNNYVLQMILIVVSVAIIAYVLFGKR